jgi:hypothetical protein
MIDTNFFPRRGFEAKLRMTGTYFFLCKNKFFGKNKFFEKREKIL